MQPGKFYLIACPFFWTFVGQFVRRIDFQDAIFAHAGYFTRTGATFDRLCATGLTPESRFHALVADLMDGDQRVPGGIIVPHQGPKFPWLAQTPWVANDR